jgi:NAD(P)-dependent dehydrogenase (short-subunit alcohol dehydrogenase family)/acyl carrier protein
MQEISGSERLEPAKALVLGPVMLAQREIAGVTCRSIDLAVPAPLPAAATAAQLLAEITSSATVAQVGWRGRKRWRLDYRMVPLDPPHPDPAPGGTYLVTGGLGALGLVVAEDLADSAPSTIVLLSRTPVPPREQWPDLVASQGTDTALRRKLVRLLAIEERGSTVVTVRCDVAQPDACAAAVRQVRERHGRIRGVYHSAGVAGGAMMAVRTDADAAAVLAPKVEGTLALYRLLAEEADFLVLFSSLTAATGTFGQVDYCAANNFQDAFARWAAQQGSPVLSVGWMQWTESGMYADREGAAPQAFRELQTGARYEPAQHPLLDRRVLGDGDVVTFSTLLEPGTHWISAEHRLGGQDVVVGTGLLEMVDGAYREAFGAVPEIRDALFLGPIGVTGPTEIRIELSPDGDGHAVTVTAAALAGAQPGEWTERLRCRLTPREAGPVPTHDLAAIAERCSRLSLTGEQCRSAGGMIEHGAHWAGNIKSMAVGSREELSRVELDERYWPECGRYRLHPALLDTAVAEANYAEDRLERGENYLPFGYGRLRAHEPLPPRFWVHISHLAEPGAEIDRMTIVLMHGDGQEIARIDEYAERRVDPAAIRAVVAGASAEASTRRRVAAQAQSIDEASISPQLGRDVLRRILHWRPAPHLLVVPEGIHRNLRRTQSLTIDVVQRELGTAILAAGHERLVETAYAPPQTQAELTIAGLWESALGVAQIGLDDEFFELGGNSLVAVQLAARMREALDVELPIAVLFDHPTVRAMAAFVAKTRAERESGEPGTKVPA